MSHTFYLPYTSFMMQIFVKVLPHSEISRNHILFVNMLLHTRIIPEYTTGRDMVRHGQQVSRVRDLHDKRKLVPKR